MSDNIEKIKKEKSEARSMSSATAKAIAFKYGGELKGSAVVSTSDQNASRRRPQNDAVPTRTINLNEKECSKKLFNTASVQRRSAVEIPDYSPTPKKTFMEKSLSFQVLSPLIRENSEQQRNKLFYKSQIQLC